jgi:hypothetical protein
MKCVSCGSSNIERKVCTYCGAPIQVSSVSALRALPEQSVNAFRTDLNPAHLNDLPNDEMSMILLTQIVVLLERRQWTDALNCSESSRNKFPQMTSFAQYYLVASIAGNFLRKQSLDQVKEVVQLLVRSNDHDTEHSNLNGYLVECVNAFWCDPNKIKFFDAPSWESDEEVIAISQFFSGDRLSGANLIFEEDGSVSQKINPREVAKYDRITEIISQNNEQITMLLSAEGFESLSDLKEKIKTEIKSKYHQKMFAVIDLSEERSTRYVDELVHNVTSVDSFYESISKVLSGIQVPLFGGGVAKTVLMEIHKVIEKEQQQLKSVTRFL